MTPPGELVRSRVVDDASRALAAMLDHEFTGHARFEPQDALLLDDAAGGVLALADGVPRAAAHDGGATGRAAVEALAGPGPFRVEWYAHPDVPAASPGAPVEAAAPADRLGDEALAERTRAAAPDAEPTQSTGAVEAFLADEDRVQAIRERAREEARDRAEEWGLDVE